MTPAMVHGGEVEAVTQVRELTLNPNSEIERPRSAPTRSQVGKKPEVFYLDTEPEV